MILGCKMQIFERNKVSVYRKPAGSSVTVRGLEVVPLLSLLLYSSHLNFFDILQLAINFKIQD
jgi:hypothetical protein